jgi:predicted PurR-regulated permease PerM
MIGTLLTLLVYALVIGLLLWLVQFVLSRFPVPEPFRNIIWIVAVVIAVIFLIMLLLDIVGGGANLGIPRIR